MNDIEETIVTFPGGSSEEVARIVAPPLSFAGKSVIVTDISPFHPLDHIWPDQPADTGHIEIKGQHYRIYHSLVGAFHETQKNRYFFDRAINARRNDPGWVFFVGHVIEAANAAFESGMRGALCVDKTHRDQLSRAHSAAHLMSLALNKALEGFWKKEVVNRDCFARPNFDALAIQTSRIDEEKSVDVYRIGKSMRKRGFDLERLKSERDGIANVISQTVNGWIEAQPTYDVLPPRSGLTERRVWQCRLDEGTARIPCGGTHLIDSETGPVVISLRFDAENTLCVTTHISSGLSAKSTPT
ncbi:MAG: hypothetical protein V6Z86_00395 [Hyphomicrobiales bacterium]